MNNTKKVHVVFKTHLDIGFTNMAAHVLRQYMEEYIPKAIALAAPGQKRLLQFDNSFVSLDKGWHFNLHNNIWGTNFPMWYGEDALFRFRLNLQSNRK